MIHLAAKIWTPDRDNGFCKMLKYITDWMPAAAHLITIMQVLYPRLIIHGSNEVKQAETYCHYGSQNTIKRGGRASASPLNTFVEVYQTLGENIDAKGEEKEGEKAKKEKQKDDLSIPVGKHVLTREELMAIALVDLHLQLNYMSPLNTCQQQEPEYPDDTEFLDSTEFSEYDSDPELGDFERNLSSSEIRGVRILSSLTRLTVL